MSFDEDRLPVPVRPDLTSALRRSFAEIADPGTWWTGAQRVAMASIARRERQLRDRPPWLREKGRERGEAAAAAPEPALPETAREAAGRIAVEAYRIDRGWAAEVIDEIGDAPYVEIVSVVITAIACDAFCEALGVELEPLPEPQAGEPSRIRPPGLADVGCWAPCVEDFDGPRVARAISLVPRGTRTFFRLVKAMYAGDDFDRLVWSERPLSRPQVELVAARVSALNQCFY